MKKIIIFIIVFNLIGVIFGQEIPIDPISKHFVYEGIVVIDSMKGEDIFNYAKEWIVRTLKSSDNNINLNDKESKFLTATGSIHLQSRRGVFFGFADINVNFKFSVFIKEGKYKFIIENFYHHYTKFTENRNTSESGPFEELKFGNSKKKKVYKEANLKILDLANNLEMFIKSSKNKKNDW